MALSDTARLIASLELRDQFTPAVKGVMGSLDRLDSRLGKIGRRTSILGGAISTALGFGLVTAVNAGMRGLTGAFTAGQRSLEELEAVGLRTNAVIQSTGGIAGITASQVRDLAESYEDLTTNDDKVIQNAENLLLTFTNIRKDAFEPTLQAVLDMNAALGGGDEGLQGTAILVGKALQDPLRGLTALRRVGVNFSEDQKKQIASLLKQNDLFGAQQVILGELNKEFGGQAGVFGTGKAAGARRLQDAIEDFQKAFAEGLTPAVDAAREGLTKLLRDPAVVSGIKDFGSSIASLFTKENIDEGIGLLKDAFQTVKDVLPTLKDAAVISGQVLKGAIDLFKSLPPDLQKLAIAALVVNKVSGGAATSVVKGILELGLSSLKTITAGNVTVVGANVAEVGGVGGRAGALGGPLGLVAGTIFVAALAEAINLGIQNGLTAREKYLAGRPAILPAGYNTGGYTTPRTGGSNLIDRQIVSVGTLVKSVFDPILNSSEYARFRAEETTDTKALIDAMARNVTAFSHPDWLKEWEASLKSNPLHKAFEDAAAKLTSGTATLADLGTILAGVQKGQGTASYQTLIDALQKARLTTTDPKQLAAIDAILKASAHWAPIHKYIEQQYAKAEKIAASSESTKDKIADLTKIQRDLKAHGDTHAVAKIGELITALKNKKLSLTLKDYIALQNFNKVAAYFSEAGTAPTLQKVLDSSTIFKAQSTSTQTALASGGPAQKGYPYIVGEKGPEVFVPDETGYVVSNGIATARSHGGNAYAYGLDRRPVTNVYVNFGLRRITTAQRREDIWHSVVEQ
jgi:hypothetical protein